MLVPGLASPLALLPPPSALPRAGERGGERERERLMFVEQVGTVDGRAFL
jgi:hypothetical protein